MVTSRVMKIIGIIVIIGMIITTVGKVILVIITIMMRIPTKRFVMIIATIIR